MATLPQKSSNTRNGTRSHGQQGGTVLGLIIGLIIGLGIALAVALSISKTGLPFTNKGAQPRAPESSGSSSAITADPNKPLYGNKDASKDAARDFAKPAEEAAPATLPAAKPEAKPEPKPEARPEVRPEARPQTAAKPAAEPGKAQIVEKSVTEKPAAKPDAGDEKFIYYLQAGAFRAQADADNAKAKLALLGFEARVTERPSDSGTLYRVRVGPFAQIETMNRIREKLSESGVDVAVVRSPK